MTKEHNEFVKVRVTKTIDTGYNNGSVICKCGWSKALGDGYNTYYIGKCPSCSPDEVGTITKRKIITPSGNMYDVKLGVHRFFGLSNGLVIVYDSTVSSEYKKVTGPKALDI